MDELAQRFPEDIEYLTVYDTTVFVTSTIEAIIHTLLEAFLLVALVVFVFLGKLRTTIIPLLAVPVSIIGTFAVLLVRSEEHTSELQSLMRISSAVFCLQKKNI